MGHPPRGLTGLDRERWDFVITVCDRAKEACPGVPGPTDPGALGHAGPRSRRRGGGRAAGGFVDALTLISRRVDLLLALPVEKLDRLIVEAQVQAIGEVGTGDYRRWGFPDVRYALISDIHANLPALKAVHADTLRRNIGAVYHLGDLVGYAPWPDETVAMIAALGIPGVAGNYDSTVATDYKHCGCRYEDPHQEELSHLSYDWTRRHVSAKTKAYLGGLPFRIDLLPQRRPPGRTTGRAGAWHADAEHRLLDRGPARRVLPQDGEPCRNEAGRRDRLRPHPQAVASRGGRHALREHRQRRAAQGRRLAGRVRRCWTSVRRPP